MMGSSVCCFVVMMEEVKEGRRLDVSLAGRVWDSSAERLS